MGKVILPFATQPMPRKSTTASLTEKSFPTELPFQLASLALGFPALLKRLRADIGTVEEVALGMGSVFFALLERDDCQMKDLGGRLRIPKGTLSGLLSKMEAQGIIERHPHLSDGRAWCIRLTRKARRMEAGLRERHSQALEILHAGFSERDAATLQRLLGRVIENVRAHEARSGEEE